MTQLGEGWSNDKNGLKFTEVFFPVLAANLICLAIFVALVAYLMYYIREAWIKKTRKIWQWLENSGATKLIHQLGDEAKKYGRNVPLPMTSYILETVGGAETEQSSDDPKPKDSHV